MELMTTSKKTWLFFGLNFFKSKFQFLIIYRSKMILFELWSFCPMGWWYCKYILTPLFKEIKSELV